jgi:hypothetical protein
MQHTSAFYVILAGGLFIRHLFSSKDQTLLGWWNAFFLLNPFLYSGDLGWLGGDEYFVVGVNVNFDFLSCKCLDFYKHLEKRGDVSQK